MSTKNVCGECRHSKLPVSSLYYCEKRDWIVGIRINTGDCKSFERKDK
jgi:hypothetical protein